MTAAVVLTTIYTGVAFGVFRTMMLRMLERFPDTRHLPYCSLVALVSAVIWPVIAGERMAEEWTP